jgi:hypothetical protein
MTGQIGHFNVPVPLDAASILELIVQLPGPD